MKLHKPFYRSFVIISIVVLLFSLGIVQGEMAVKLKPSQIPPYYAGKERTPFIPIQEIEQSSQNYLIGKISQGGMVETEEGLQDTTFEGEIRFIATQGEKGELELTLDRLNLISPGVKTERGDTGLIGISLEQPGIPVRYDSDTGKIYAEFSSTLHYDLIDQTLGFTRARSEEGDVFLSKTETMSGILEGNIQEKLNLSALDSVALDSELSFTIDQKSLGLIYGMKLLLKVNLAKLLSPSDTLIIQPVFIGTGPSDPSRTGKVYETLLRNASNIWDRCGSVRCIKLSSNTPIYINNNNYKVLNDESEAIKLMAEVNDAKAVEVFIVEKVWDPVGTGGGACYSSGTASAKIVSCDQQLDVPCPPPCGSGSCGAVNFFHLGHELGHAIGLLHYGDSWPGLTGGTSGSVMDPSGLCKDNPAIQSSKNCKSAKSPLFTTGKNICVGKPDIMD